jgi:hypothetical protein
MSLTKKELWDIYIEKNPQWMIFGSKLTPAGLKKLVEQSYQHGLTKGKEIGAAMEKVKNYKVPESKDSYSNDILNDLFKGFGQK